MTWEEWVLIGLIIYAVCDIGASLWAACFAEKVVAQAIVEEEIEREGKEE